MKKIGIVVLLVLLVILASVSMVEHKIDTRDYLRIHIRANSNSDIDQDIKYNIKGKIVTLLSPRLEGVDSPDEAKRIVYDSLTDIDKIANDTLKSSNLPYRAHSVMRREHFPTRHYGNVTLDAGMYDALVVELGSAEGDNWWCVVYPPLCFVTSEETGTGEFRYVSKIAELINKWRGIA